MSEKGLISCEMRERKGREKIDRRIERKSRMEAERKRTPENCNLQL